MGTLAAEGLNAREAIAAQGAPAGPVMTVSEAVARLREGNARYVAGKPTCGPVTARRVALASGQSPFAVVLGCSDSRVPVELVFDREPGDIFVVRVAGNFVDDYGLASIEYAVAALHSPSVVVVLGHSSCGALKAAVSYVEHGTENPGHIQELVRAVAPAVKATRGKPGDWVENAIVENVRLNVHAVVQRSPIVATATAHDAVAVVGAVYDLASGKVDFLTD